jgi:hypothetical protein
MLKKLASFVTWRNKQILPHYFKPMRSLLLSKHPKKFLLFVKYVCVPILFWISPRPLFMPYQKWKKCLFFSLATSFCVFHLVLTNFFLTIGMTYFLFMLKKMAHFNQAHTKTWVFILLATTFQHNKKFILSSTLWNNIHP